MVIEKEATLINQSPEPVTTQSLVEDLCNLGVQPGSVVLVHSAMSKLGWVCGGPVAFILALEEVLGVQGTLVMPTHSGDNSDPIHWQNPPVPKEWVETIRQTMPAYDEALTPTRGMGKIPETFRRQMGTIRSAHPQLSFAARGPLAHVITENHQLEIEMGDGSPLHKIYQHEGWVLLAGVGFGNNTSFHLAEHWAVYPSKKRVPMACAMMIEGNRKWVDYMGFDYDDADFEKIGQAFLETNPHLKKTGNIGQAQALLLPQKPLVDFAVDWMNKYRHSES